MAAIKKNVAHSIETKKRTNDIEISEKLDFSSLFLSDVLLDGLKSSGFVRPSPIQLKAIPLGRCGLDLIVQAKSGTGKTCVFAVIALDGLNLDALAPQVLVLAPTREIALQIHEVFLALGSSMAALRCQNFIGGMPVHEDKLKIKNCHVVIGTPGRVKQLIEQGIFRTDSVRLFVLDEADKLLEESFQKQVNWIYSTLPENKQILALSATYPEYLAQHLTAYMRDPTFVRLNVHDPALLGIKQYYVSVAHHPLPNKVFDHKSAALIQLLSNVKFQQCLVFSNYQTRAEDLSNLLNARGWPSVHIAGSQDQRARNEAMSRLKTFKCRILISTDLTSRGIDCDKVNLVVNLDLPPDHETYLHRIGRAGRFGSFGAAVSLVSEGKELADMKKVEKRCCTTIKPLPDPVPTNLTESSEPIYLDDLVSSQKLSSLRNGDVTNGDSDVTNGADDVTTPTSNVTNDASDVMAGSDSVTDGVSHVTNGADDVINGCYGNQNGDHGNQNDCRGNEGDCDKISEKLDLVQISESQDQGANNIVENGDDDNDLKLLDSVKGYKIVNRDDKGDQNPLTSSVNNSAIALDDESQAMSPFTLDSGALGDSGAQFSTPSRLSRDFPKGFSTPQDSEDPRNVPKFSDSFYEESTGFSVKVEDEVEGEDESSVFGKKRDPRSRSDSEASDLTDYGIWLDEDIALDIPNLIQADEVEYISEYAGPRDEVERLLELEPTDDVINDKSDVIEIDIPKCSNQLLKSVSKYIEDLAMNRMAKLGVHSNLFEDTVTFSEKGDNDGSFLLDDHRSSMTPSNEGTVIAPPVAEQPEKVESEENGIRIRKPKSSQKSDADFLASIRAKATVSKNKKPAQKIADTQPNREETSSELEKDESSRSSKPAKNLKRTRDSKPVFEPPIAEPEEEGIRIRKPRNLEQRSTAAFLANIREKAMKEKMAAGRDSQISSSSGYGSEINQKITQVAENMNSGTEVKASVSQKVKPSPKRSTAKIIASTQERTKTPQIAVSVSKVLASSAQPLTSPVTAVTSPFSSKRTDDGTTDIVYLEDLCYRRDYLNSAKQSDSESSYSEDSSDDETVDLTHHADVTEADDVIIDDNDGYDADYWENFDADEYYEGNGENEYYEGNGENEYYEGDYENGQCYDPNYGHDDEYAYDDYGYEYYTEEQEGNQEGGKSESQYWYGWDPNDAQYSNYSHRFEPWSSMAHQHSAQNSKPYDWPKPSDNREAEFYDSYFYWYSSYMESVNYWRNYRDWYRRYMIGRRNEAMKDAMARAHENMSQFFPSSRRVSKSSSRASSNR